MATTTALVVMEHGSDWLGPIGNSTNVVIFGEENNELLERTEHKLSMLERGNERVRLAVLTCNGTTGPRASAARTRLVRTLLRAVSGSVRGRVVVSASSAASLELRSELAELVGALNHELHAAGAIISLTFVEAKDGAQTPRLRRLLTHMQRPGPDCRSAA